MIRSTEEKTMKKATAITCVFLDIGGVLLTDGWDHHARKRAATNFKLDLAEMEDRHHLTFDTYEEGKLTLEEYLRSGGVLREATVHTGSVSGIHVRPVATLSRDDRVGPPAQGTVWIEDRRGQQRSAGIEFASDSQVQAGSSSWISLFPPASSTSASPTRTSFGLRWTSPRCQPEQVVYIENTPMFVQIAEGLGIRSILHTDYKSTCAKLASFGLQNDEGVIHEAS